MLLAIFISVVLLLISVSLHYVAWRMCRRSFNGCAAPAIRA